MSNRLIAGATSAGLFVAGLILGFLHVTANGTFCGSAFFGSQSSLSTDDGSCSTALSAARPLPIALLIVGFALGLAVVSTIGGVEPQEPSAAKPSTTTELGAG